MHHTPENKPLHSIANPWEDYDKQAKRKANLGTRLKGKCLWANKSGYHSRQGEGPTHVPFPEGYAGKGDGFPVNRTLTETADGLLVTLCPGCSRVLRPKRISALESLPGVWEVVYPHHYAHGGAGRIPKRHERPDTKPLTDLDLATLLDLAEARIAACGPRSKPVTAINTYDLVSVLRDLLEWRRAAKLIAEQTAKR